MRHRISSRSHMAAASVRGRARLQQLPAAPGIELTWRAGPADTSVCLPTESVWADSAGLQPDDTTGRQPASGLSHPPPPLSPRRHNPGPASAPTQPWPRLAPSCRHLSAPLNTFPAPKPLGSVTQRAVSWAGRSGPRRPFDRHARLASYAILRPRISAQARRFVYTEERGGRCYDIRDHR